jgi:hypothetical protein
MAVRLCRIRAQENILELNVAAPAASCVRQRGIESRIMLVESTHGEGHY